MAVRLAQMESADMEEVGDSMAPKTTRWKLDPHTLAKHEILRGYLGAWFPILTSGGFNRRVVFLDGFAGPGIYSAGEKGSPIIALDTLVSHKVFERLSHTEFILFFVESKADRVASLREQVSGFWDSVNGGQPSNVRVEIVEGSFEAVADDLLTSLEESGRNLAPTFAFVDPFGFSGVPMSILARIGKYPKCEIFFNFMYDALNRFVTHPGESIHAHLGDLFGTEEYKEADGLPPPERKAFLHDLYGKQLKVEAGCKYVQSFEMVGMSGHTTYSLFFGTKNLKGLEVMKSAMWRLDPIEGGRFSDRVDGVEVLFQPEPDYAPLRNKLRTELSGRELTMEQVKEFVLVETPYPASGFKKGALKPMQAAGELDATNQGKAGTFPDRVRVRFR